MKLVPKVPERRQRTAEVFDAEKILSDAMRLLGNSTDRARVAIVAEILVTKTDIDRIFDLSVEALEKNPDVEIDGDLGLLNTMFASVAVKLMWLDRRLKAVPRD